MGCQLFQECAVGDSAKGLAEVQIDNIHSPSCIHQVGHLVIKGDQVGQTPPTPPKAMLAGSDPLAILIVFALDSTQGLIGENEKLVLPSVQDNRTPQQYLISLLSFRLFLQTAKLKEPKSAIKIVEISY
ncbi:hypothetical protein HGM15179_002237 [Zosterops borbonicus]|uniref:Uncharacterized protein n=1 Tax=Zosterops borbonicus TaxID=364589 RepID=A0A8K1LTA5_9PASS|nr:hypothetical protein HGM15179_002237 [Zosterops borbonicus]